MKLSDLKKPDVDALFGQSHASVQGLAAQGIHADLQLLSYLETGKPTSPFSAEDMTHFRSVTKAHLRDHPLGFLAQTSPVIAQGLLQDALRRDVVKRMGAYTHASGDFKAAQHQIAALSHRSSAEFAADVQHTFTVIHRETLRHSAATIAQMIRAVKDGLWGTGTQDEHTLAQHFRHSARELNAAITLFEDGKTDEAIARFSRIMEENGGYAAWFERSLKVSDRRKFAAHIGVAMAAGAAAYFTGGASLALMGGQEAAFGAHITSMLIGGAGMTVTSRGLNAAVFNHRFLSAGTPFEQAIDFGGDLLTNTALMGWLRLGNIAGAGLPMMAGGEPALATAFNATRSFGIEWGGFTSFNMMSSASHLFDENRPSIDDVLSKQALAENAAFVLGLRGGHAALGSAKFMGRHAIKAATGFDTRLVEVMHSRRFAQFALSPLALMTGIPTSGFPGSRVTDPTGVTPLSDAFGTLNEKLGTKPNVAHLWQERPYKFWGILNLLDLGVPPALVAYGVLKTQVDPQTRELMGEFQSLLQDTKVKEALGQLRDKGMKEFLKTNGIGVWSDKFRLGTELMDRYYRAHVKMLDYVSKYLALARADDHIVGMEYEGKTHLGLFEEVVWPDDEPFRSRGPDELSARDQLTQKLSDALQKKTDSKGNPYETELVPGKPYFSYADKPTIFPTIFERYKDGTTVVKSELLTGTGAVIVSVLPEGDPMRAKTEHVKGAKSVFEDEVESKAAEMVTSAMKLNVDDESPEEAIDLLRKRPGAYSLRHLIQAKALDNDILKIWITFNPDGTAELAPINGAILDHRSGNYVTTLTIPAEKYDEVAQWIGDTASGNKVFAKKTDKYEGVNIKGFGLVTMTDEAHPYKEIVSPKLTFDKFDTWLDVVEILGTLGITGTTPFNLVGTHEHGNLPVTFDSGPKPTYTILPVLGILRGFVDDVEMIYDGIPNHPNRLGFIQKLPLWFRERLKNSSYVTDPTDKRQILRLAADLARDVKKYNAMNLSNHLSALLALLIDKGIFTNGEEIETTHDGEKYNFYVVANANVPEAHDIIRTLDCASYTVSIEARAIAITGFVIPETWNTNKYTDFFRNVLHRTAESGRLDRLQPDHSIRVEEKLHGDEYLFQFKRADDGTVTITVQQQVHLIRVAKDVRKTTAELRIFDAIFDRETAKYFLNFYYAWSWWYGTGQFLNPAAPASAAAPVVEGALQMITRPPAVHPDPIYKPEPENTD